MADNDKPNNTSVNKPSEENAVPKEGLATELPPPPAFLEKIGQAYRTTTAKEHFEEQRLAEIDEDKIRKLAEKADMLRKGSRGVEDVKLKKGLEEAIKNLEEKQEKYEGRVDAYHEVRKERFSKLAETKTAEEFDVSGGGIMAASKSPEAQLESAKYLGMEPKKLDESKTAGQARLKELKNLAVKQAPNELSSDPEKVKESRELLSQYTKEKDEIVKTLGVQTAAQRYMKVTGKDEESKQSELLKAGVRAEKTLNQVAVGEKLKPGGELHSVDLQDLKKKEIELSKEFVKALEDMKNATDETSRSTAQATATKKKEGLDENQEAQRQGGGQGGKRGSLGAKLNIFGAIAGAIADTFENIAIKQTNQITQNRTSAASITNDLYAKRMAVASGDMTQMGMFEQGAFKEAADEAEKSRRNKQGVNILKMASTAAITAGTVMSVTGIGAAFGVPLLAAGLISSRALGGISETVSGAADIFRGGSASTEQIEEYHRQVSRREAELQITGHQRQRLSDFGQGMRGVALAAGRGQGNAMMQEMESGGSTALDRVQRTGLSPEDFTRLAAPAARAQGSQFNLDQVEQAQKYQRAGVADIETNMSSFTRLAAAGPGQNNPQTNFASVLEVAFTKSLNSAESLTKLVENTAATAERSGAAAVGLDAQKAAAGITAAFIDPNIKNKELAVDRAATVAEMTEKERTGFTPSISDQLKVTAIGKAGNVKRRTAIAIQNTDTTTMETFTMEAQRVDELRKTAKDPRENAAAKAAQEDLAHKMRISGLGGLIDEKTGRVRTEALEETTAVKKGGGLFEMRNLLISTQLNQEFKKIGLEDTKARGKEIGKTGSDKFLRENPAIAAIWGEQLKVAGDKRNALDMVSGAYAPTNATLEGEKKAKEAKEGEGGSELGKTLQQRSEMGGKAATMEAQKAAEAFGSSLKKAFDYYLDQQNKNQKALLSTDNKAAENLSKDFSGSIPIFSSAVTTFGNAVNVLAAKLGVQAKETVGLNRTVGGQGSQDTSRGANKDVGR